jgi:hypothetical protein
MQVAKMDLLDSNIEGQEGISEGLIWQIILEY